MYASNIFKLLLYCDNNGILLLCLAFTDPVSYCDHVGATLYMVVDKKMVTTHTIVLFRGCYNDQMTLS